MSDWLRLTQSTRLLAKTAHGTRRVCLATESLRLVHLTVFVNINTICYIKKNSLFTLFAGLRDVVLYTSLKHNSNPNNQP
jgi:hypothetical protein